jgi:DNA (cytosine-5)-methyltransferase 1
MRLRTMSTIVPVCMEVLLVTTKTFLEFFAGIGLVGEALRDSGWTCIYANDIDPKKKKVFEEHYGATPHYHLGDVWSTDEAVGRIKGRPALATASFPCTDLSLAGHWKGLDGSESSTYFGFLKAIERLGDRKPRLIMLENVTGFLTANNGEDFPRAVRKLAELGYWIDSFVIDAKYFVPQSRPRLFVIGLHCSVRSPLVTRQDRERFFGDPWRSEIDSLPELRPAKLVRAMVNTELPTGWFTVPLKPPTPTGMKLDDIIDLDDGQDWWDEPQVRKHYGIMHDYHREKIDEFLRTGASYIGTIFRRTRGGSMKAEVRFDGVAGCLRTTKGGSARQIVYAVANGKLRMRWMSPREYARLQGAEDFAIGESHNQSMYGFGDAVCVPVVRWIDRNVLTPLFESTAEVKAGSTAVA